MTRAARGPAGSRHHVARNVRTARQHLGWSLHEFGIRSGIKPAYVGAIERAEFNVGIDNLDLIAAGLGVAPYLLLLNPETARPLMELHLRLVRGEQRLGRQRQLVERCAASARDLRLANSVLAAMVEHQQQLEAMFQALQEPAHGGPAAVSSSAARRPLRRR